MQAALLLGVLAVLAECHKDALGGAGSLASLARETAAAALTAGPTNTSKVQDPNCDPAAGPSNSGVLGVTYADVPLQGSLNATVVQGENDCTPQCKWQCDTPKCDETCSPVCAPPKCQTRCGKPDLAACSMDCTKSQCAMVCPKSLCANCNAARKCTTSCSAPLCKLSCPAPQSCHNVCEEPSCEWDCVEPKDCPAPKCSMVCEHPPDCLGETYKALPSLSPGEMAVGNFNAQNQSCTTTTMDANGEVLNRIEPLKLVQSPQRIVPARQMVSASVSQSHFVQESTHTSEGVLSSVGSNSRLGVNN